MARATLPGDGYVHAGIKPAALVWERDKAMALEITFEVPVGEHVRVYWLHMR